MPSGFIVVVLALIALLTMSATAIRSVSRLWLRHWQERRPSGRAGLRMAVEHPTRLVHAAGTATALLVFAWGGYVVGANGADLWALLRDAVITVALFLVFGQLLPRAVGRRWAPQLAPRLVPVLLVTAVLVNPVMLVARAVVRWCTPADVPSGDAREGLEDLLRDGTFEQMGSTEEMEIISGVMQFGEKTVADVMTRREDIFAVSSALPPAAMAQEIAASGYSRVPIYHDSLDSIAGMLHVFDVFAVGGTRVPGLRPMARTIPSRPATELLFDLLRSRRQVAIVADDTGRTVGLVTMEDLLEELVGEIRDEHDELGPTDAREGRP